MGTFENISGINITHTYLNLSSNFSQKGYCAPKKVKYLGLWKVIGCRLSLRPIPGSQNVTMIHWLGGCQMISEVLLEDYFMLVLMSFQTDTLTTSLVPMWII